MTQPAELWCGPCDSFVHAKGEPPRYRCGICGGSDVEVKRYEPDPDPLLSIRKSRLREVLREAVEWGVERMGEPNSKVEREYIARALTELEQA